MKKTVLQYYLIFSSLFSLFPFFGGCASVNTTAQLNQPSNHEEKADFSCAYFYFLWGTHAEYDNHLNEALEAFEKATICDPAAEYIAEKIPIILIKLGKMDEAVTWLQAYLLEHPEKTVQRFLLARLKIQVGAIQEAIDLYKEALTYEPLNRNVLLRLGLLYGQLKQYEKAKSIFHNLLDKDPQLYFAHLYLARLFSQTGDFDSAAEKYERALAINWSHELVYEIADFFHLLKQHEKALSLYALILANDNEDERAILGSVQSLLYLDRYEEALKMLTSLRRLSKEPYKIDLIIAQILINRNTYPEAERLLNSVISEHSSSEAYYLLGVGFFEQKKFAKALEALKQIDKNAEEYEYTIYLQVKIFSETHQFEKARDLLVENIAEEKTRKPVFYTYLASLYQDNDNLTAALKTLSTGVIDYPQNERLHFEYGLVLETTGKSEQAISVMKKVLELQPNHPEALNFIGYTWANNNQNLELALEYIQQAVLIRPDSGYIRDSLGWVYFRLGNFEQAKIELENALALEPADPHIYDHLGDIYRAMTNREKALEEYRKALEMFTEDDKKKTVQDKIDALSES